jgi:hypothetical protein
VVGCFLFISSYKDYKNNSFDGKKHKKIGKAIFVALTISSIMGICIYTFLFVFFNYKLKSFLFVFDEPFGELLT